MSGLNERDLTILGHYAQQGNRELYWNYLAQHPGNDGYGTLALGVVRNDNAPGRVANLHADMRARSDGREMSERDWERFGVDLITRDLAMRREHVREGHPELALNLPARDVQRAHDQSFTQAGINPNAWTPRQLLEGARRTHGEAEVERVWDHMLDNGALGLGRTANTLYDIGRNLPPGEATTYTGRLAAVRATAMSSESNLDPDRIQRSPMVYEYSARHRTWTESAQISGPDEGMGASRTVTDRALIAELNDARAVRLHRQEMRDDFHPADPNRGRPLMRSPAVLSDAGEPAREPGRGEARVQLARADYGDYGDRGGGNEPAPFDPRRADHPQHSLYCQCRDGVQRLDAAHGRSYDEGSERLTARLTQLASDNRFDRVDAVVLSRGTERLGAGENVFVVRGDPTDPASQRAHTNTREAMETKVEQSFQALAMNPPQPTQQQAALQQEQQAEQQRNPARSMA
ncbi:XVIPCD domain-containing protein [Lysobacter capsici]|uniref:LtaE-like protein n=1 Tax=Lysobacter enzymogenes TaxID=69 RepID=A0AAU8BUT0_LYSEN|nr:XVIPCD domain-containing protein [Lysobacter capsici]QWF17483.1 hypothetical protein KME82_01370 [Lysobacter capsici]